MESLLSSLENSAPALVLRESAWLYPATEVVHIVGFVILVGAAFVLDLRLLGVFRKLPLRETVRGLSYWARFGLALAVTSGAILFIVDAGSLAANTAFRLKLVVLGAALLNAFVFHRLVLPRLGGHGRVVREQSPLPPAARVAGVLSIVLWIAVIAFGRWIAYL